MSRRHVRRFEGKRRQVWRADYRLPDGRQVNRTIGPTVVTGGRAPTLRPRTKAKVLTVPNGVLKRACRVHNLGYNAMADVEKPRFRASTTIEVFSPEEVWALVRVAEFEQDAAVGPGKRERRIRPRRRRLIPGT